MMQPECGSSDSESDNETDLKILYGHNKLPSYKVILLGETGSGKTSLFLRYKHGCFRKGYTLQKADRFTKEFTTDDGEKVQMVLWDTAGMERAGSLTFHYYHDTKAVLLVFSMDDCTTFDRLAGWIEELLRYAPKDAKRFLVATKCDIPEEKMEIQTEKLHLFCMNKNISAYYLTSAKTGEGIQDMFENIMRILRQSVDTTNDEKIWLVSFPKAPKNKRTCNC